MSNLTQHRIVAKSSSNQMFKMADMFQKPLITIPEKSEPLKNRYIKIAGAVAAYWSISIPFVFLNKHLLNSDELKLDATTFVTWFQCVVTVLLCFIMSRLALCFPNVVSFPDCRIRRKTMINVLPLSIVFLAMIIFNNLCLKNVGVAFYFVGRSLTTVFNVVFTFLILGVSTSLPALGCCAAIIGGFWLGVQQEGVSGTLSWSGVFFGVGASAFVALNAIYAKKVLPSVNDSVWRLTFYNNINASILFIPFIFFTGEVTTIANFPLLYSSSFWLPLILSGVFGFAIGYVTGLQIQLTSPLTHNVSGTAKACAQTVLGCAYFSEVKTALWWFSNVIVLLASFAYTIVKRGEMRTAHFQEMSQLAEKLEEGKASND